MSIDEQTRRQMEDWEVMEAQTALTYYLATETPPDGRSIDEHVRELSHGFLFWQPMK